MTTRTSRSASADIVITPGEIEAIVQRAVSAAVSDIQKLFNDKLDELRNRLVSVETKFHDFDERMLKLETQMDSYRNNEKGLDKTTSELSDELKAIRSESRESLLQSNDNEQYSRRNNIRINGLQPQDDCRHQVAEFVKKVLHVSGVEVTDIEAAHSVFGGQNTGSNGQDSAATPVRRPVVLVRFFKREHRDKVILARRILKGTKFAITEDLTALNVRTMNRLRNSDIVRNSWTWNGKIFAILSNGRKVVVRPFQSLQDLI